MAPSISGDRFPLSLAAPLTIVTYHYVHPIAGSRYPALKALDVGHFKQQLKYFGRHYQFVSIADVVAAREEGRALPEQPLLLTFDDGYRDHYEHVWPALREIGTTGAFYPTADATLGHSILDVNKIHFILAAVDRHDALVDAIDAAVHDDNMRSGGLTVAEYRLRYWTGNRFDAAPVLYCKQLLQHALPDTLRRPLLDQLFGRFVSADPAAFGADLYVNLAQLSDMRESGMHIGGHGATHRWLDRLPRSEQTVEIDRSLYFLQLAGMSSSDVFTFCYPYGGYNDVTIELLRERGCHAGLTVRPDLVDLRTVPMLELPRLDTNDLPHDPSAAPDLWTARARASR